MHKTPAPSCHREDHRRLDEEKDDEEEEEGHRCEDELDQLDSC